MGKPSTWKTPSERHAYLWRQRQALSDLVHSMAQVELMSSGTLIPRPSTKTLQPTWEGSADPTRNQGSVLPSISTSKSA